MPAFCHGTLNTEDKRHRLSIMTRNLKLASQALLTGLAVLVGGCSQGGPDTYPVEGRVQYSDGSPFPGGTIQLQLVEDKTAPIARGLIEPDGTFCLITPPDIEGVVTGAYHVAVRGLAPTDEPGMDERALADKSTIHPRFSKFESSEIQVTVEPHPNRFTITVERP